MRITVLIILFSVSHFLQAQINVGSKEFIVGYNSGLFEAENLASLKKTKTFFIYRESDIETLEQLKSSLKEVWTYTDLVFISYNEYTTTEFDSRHSFLSIAGLNKIKTSSSGTVTNSSYFYLCLWMNNGNDKLIFSRIELFPAYPSHLQFIEYSKDKNNSLAYHLYTDAVIHNWSLYYLKTALQFVNTKLSASKNHRFFGEVYNPKLGSLKKDTLLIPNYILTKFGAFTGDESKRHDPKKLLKGYRYPYKIVHTSEINNRILNSKNPTYFLSYIKSSSDKFISVFNGQNGELLYTDYKPISYNINNKDIKKLRRMVK